MGEFPLLYSFFEFDGFLYPSQPVRLTAPSSKGARQGENVFFAIRGLQNAKTALY